MEAYNIMPSSKKLPSDSSFRKDLVYLILEDKANAYVINFL